MKKNESKIEQLKHIYEGCMKYLEIVKKRDDLRKRLSEEISENEQNLREANGIPDLEKEREELLKIIYKYEDKERDNRYDFDEDGISFFSNDEIIEYFEAKKKYYLLGNKIKDIINDINKKNNYSDMLYEKYNHEESILKKKIFESASKIMNLENLTKGYDGCRYEILVETIISNSEYYSDHDYFSKNNKLYTWFCNMPLKSPLCQFTTKKLLPYHLSTFDYFLRKLEQHTKQKYRRVDIVTNEIIDNGRSYCPADKFYLTCATMLLPESMAEEMVSSEKKYNWDKLEKFLEQHRDAVLVNLVRVDINKNKYNDQKFNYKYRESIRKKLFDSKESNTISLDKLFGINNGDHYHIIGTLPIKNLAEAIFDTMEYSEKLVKFVYLAKALKRYNANKHTNTESEELVKM